MEFTARHAGTARFSLSRSSREALTPGPAPRERGRKSDNSLGTDSTDLTDLTDLFLSVDTAASHEPGRYSL